MADARGAAGYEPDGRRGKGVGWCHGVVVVAFEQWEVVLWMIGLRNSDLVCIVGGTNGFSSVLRLLLEPNKLIRR